jgi:hypothetical protein
MTLPKANIKAEAEAEAEAHIHSTCITQVERQLIEAATHRSCKSTNQHKGGQIN